MSDKPHAAESATDRGHGTHGKGDSREELDSNPQIRQPTIEQGDLDSTAEATSKLADGQWGAEASGGSVVDKRPPEDRTR